MEEDSPPHNAKRRYVAGGSTPTKPKNKRIKPTTSGIRKPLFQRDNSAGSPNTSENKSPAQKVARRIVSKARSQILSPLRKSPVKRHRWTFEEERALVEFVGIAKTDPKYGIDLDTEWPSFREGHIFWTDAAIHIQTSSSANILLSNNRVRARVCTFLRGKFPKLEAAEEKYNLTLSGCLEDLDLSRSNVGQQKVLQTNKSTQTPPPLPAAQSSMTIPHADLQKVPADLSPPVLLCLQSIGAKSLTCLIKKLILFLETGRLVEVANFSFMELVHLNGIDSNPGDFITRSISSMKILQASGKSNLLYKFAFCTSEYKEGTTSPIFPMNRMPFGLVEYQIEFFSCTNVMQITVPHDFQVWYETLCTEFPARFARLFRGPMWSGVEKAKQKDPLTARVNVAAPSTRTVEKRTAQSDFTSEPGLQLSALKELKEAHPKGRFWLKADACDLKAVLQQSMRGDWNGDINLGDGKMQKLREEFEGRVGCLNVDTMERTQIVFEERIRVASDLLQRDVAFLANGLTNAEQLYRAKLDVPNTSQTMLRNLCWETVEFNTLLQHAQVLQTTLDDLVLYLDPANPRVDEVAVCLQNLSQDLKSYFRNLFVKKRQPAATHVLLMMVSDERRNRKPYALPVQYVPYHTIRDQYIRDLSKNIKLELTKLGMNIVGMVTDGEFNSLRTRGETRAVHIWQILHDARESVSRQKENTLVKMLTKIGEDAHGHPITRIHDEAIPTAVVQGIDNLRVTNGWSMVDAVTFWRRSLVPDGYVPHPFRSNTPESYLDKLRSLVATYRFRHQVEKFKLEGVDFSTFMYVPEVDPTTGAVFHEREDHCHILKRIWKHTREGGPETCDVTSFDAAMLDPTTGLTYAALTGDRKQSVPDAERMLSYLVSKFLRNNGYATEASYVDAVAGWHEAADGRGLTELQRSRKNYAMLNMVLDEWMPWHKDLYDFSTIDVNRPVKGICGFSRETVIAVTTNIESVEYRRRQNFEIGYEEHPRAGTSDDVEAIIALFHRFLGNVFTLKEFKSCWRKVVREFCKRMDVDLPFYYWTANERYRDWDDELPSFNEGPEVDEDTDAVHHPLRLHRLTLNRREDSSIFTAGRSFLPARNQTSIRQRLHRPVVDLPPNPNVDL